MMVMEGFWQALRVAVYMSLVSTVMSHGNEWFGKVDQTVGPIMFLLLFGVSVLVCALLVFAKPYKLFTEKKGTEALELVIATTKWLAVFLLLVFGWVLVQ